VKRPGSNRPERRSPITASEAAWIKSSEEAWRRFSDEYRGPFHKAWPDGVRGAGLMLDVVSDALFDPDTLTFPAVNKAEIFSTYLEPLEGEDESLGDLTPEGADAALRFLVDQNMVVVEGDMISIHPRFADVLTSSPAPPDAIDGPVSTPEPV